MTCVCVFKVIGCVCVRLSLLCRTSFWLRLNKQDFPSFVWAVGSFADHLTPVLTCFSTCASTSADENRYRWELALSSSSSFSSRHRSRRKFLPPSSMLSSSTPSSASSLSVVVNLNLPIILKEQTVHLTFWGKREKLNQHVLLGCFGAAKMRLNSTRGTMPSISVWRQKREMTKQSVFCIQSVFSISHPAFRKSAFHVLMSLDTLFKASYCTFTLLKCPGEVQHFDISTRVLFL